MYREVSTEEVLNITSWGIHVVVSFFLIALVMVERVLTSGHVGERVDSFRVR